ncbi:MAG: hypothetical protein IT372_21680 [Polyangiaceae bacterium]|nr:hypothetical protein [Polyangiaceae bacterium]
MWITAYRDGRPVLRVAGEGEDLGEALSAAAAALAARAPEIRGGRGTRLKIDRAVAVGPVLSEHPLALALAVAPGLDGLRRRGAPAERALLPDDLVRLDAFGSTAPIASLRELRAGLDAAAALARLGDPAAGRIERVRIEGVIEEGDQALPVQRGNTPGPPPGPAAFHAAAVAGGEFLLRQQQGDGRFNYRFLPFTGEVTSPDGGYNLSRHAGAAYMLSQLAGATGDRRYAEAAARALGWLSGQVREGCGGEGRACVPTTPSRASLGATALGLIAYLEYQSRTGDRRFEPLARALAAFALSMQRPDGELWHRLGLKSGKINTDARDMFASEQAALAFVLADRILGDPPFRPAAERALDWLTGDKYAFFLGRFIYGADHWTCLAAREAHPVLPKRRYLDFCLGYSRFIRRLQYEPGAWVNADYEGHYGFSSLLVPQAPGTAGFTEAVVATYELSALHGEPAADVRAQAEAALAALLRDQLRPDNAWLAPSPESAAGGVRRSLVEPEIRLDFTQHAASALLDGARVLGG